MPYHTHVSTRETPQSEPIPGRSDMVENQAGGYAFPTDDWVRLDRFLVLGNEGGSYYASERTMTLENAGALERCLAVDAPRAIARIVELSTSGRTPKNDPAIFALAYAAGSKDVAVSGLALDALADVARIGTHLFQFLNAVQAFRGWGRGLRDAVASWYNGKEPDRLAYQVVKYRQRVGWTHRDALRKAHAAPVSPAHDAIYAWITQGERCDDLPALIEAYEAAQAPDADLPALIVEHRLPREALPTDALTRPAVWAALLEAGMPMTALVRNLANMTRVGVLRPMSDTAKVVIAQLGDAEHIRKARIHPLTILVASRTYAAGGGYRSANTWDPISQIVDALDGAFYLAFGNVEPVGSPTVLALDVSGSMSMGGVAGSPLTPREASAALALVTARTEPDYEVIGFSNRMMKLPITAKDTLGSALAAVSGLPFMGTDCALPMLWAIDRGVDNVGGFVIYTDSETWAGGIHPTQALTRYREKYNDRAKLVTCGMVSNGFTVADPRDAGQMDVVGFDTATPNVVSDFLRE